MLTHLWGTRLSILMCLHLSPHTGCWERKLHLWGAQRIRTLPLEDTSGITTNSSPAPGELESGNKMTTEVRSRIDNNSKMSRYHSCLHSSVCFSDLYFLFLPSLGLHFSPRSIWTVSELIYSLGSCCPYWLCWRSVLHSPIQSVFQDLEVSWLQLGQCPGYYCQEKFFNLSEQSGQLCLP